MYQVADSNVLAKGGRALLRRGSSVRISRTVIFLGLTSMLTDISSEMVTAILPLYLIYSLGLSPLQFGVIDGIQGGAASLVRVASGFAADRFGRYKELAVLGYGLSAFCRVGLLVVGRSWALLGAIVFIDRTGKGIRTAPRDAMISLSSDPDSLGTAFGVHRAMDTAGAVIGPLIAFGMLVALPQGFHSIFFVSFCFALIGLAVLVLFVRNPAETEAQRDETPTAHRTGDRPAAGGAAVRRRDRGGRRARARDDERRLRLPRTAEEPRLRPARPPAAVRRDLAGVHGARGARRPACRPNRLQAGLRDGLPPAPRRVRGARDPGPGERRHRSS